MIDLAAMLLKGDGIARDADKAVALLQAAAGSDLREDALAALGQYYMSIDAFLLARHAFEELAKLGDARGREGFDLVARISSHPKLDEGMVDLGVGLPSGAAPTRVPPKRRYDPPSLLVGRRLSLQEVIRVAYDAGFTTEDSLVGAVSVAIAESQLFSAARNWQPKLGYRPASDLITVKGPQSVWFDGRQMQSDRGLWQISSMAWPEYSDSMADDPASAAAIAFVLSQSGSDFSLWDSYRSGKAQSHMDKATGGWPAVRPLVKRLLSKVAEGIGDAGSG